MSNHNGKPPDVRHILELERQQRAQEEFKYRLATTPTNLTPQTAERFSIAIIGDRIVLVLARNGAVMADGTFNAGAVAPFAAVDMAVEVLEGLYANLGQAIGRIRSAQPEEEKKGKELLS